MQLDVYNQWSLGPINQAAAPRGAMQSLWVLQRASRSARSSWKNCTQSFGRRWLNYSKVAGLELTFSGLNQDISLALGTRHTAVISVLVWCLRKAQGGGSWVQFHLCS